MLNEVNSVLVPSEEFIVIVGRVILNSKGSSAWKCMLLVTYLTVQLHGAISYRLLDVITRLCEKCICAVLLVILLGVFVILNEVIVEILVFSAVDRIFAVTVGWILGVLEVSLQKLTG